LQLPKYTNLFLIYQNQWFVTNKVKDLLQTRDKMERLTYHSLAGITGDSE
jgi:hypothetical protein